MNQVLTLSRKEAAPVVERAEDKRCTDAIAQLLDGKDLSASQSEVLFAAIVEGRLSEALMAASFVALRIKGETADELIGAALALRAAARPFPQPAYMYADSCGTGGDCSGSINISTAAALVCAAAGLPMVKHGNRSFSSKCGSADVLEALGMKLDLSPDQSRRMLDETGFCFLLATAYHPGIAHAGPVRRALKVRTVMNLLGPCLNPGRPPIQLLGVPTPAMLLPIAETLRAIGIERALVVHGSGLDEVALHGFTQCVRVDGATIESFEITPEQAGLGRHPLQRIAGGTPAENAERLRALLAGNGAPADRSIVALNAGALLHTAGLAANLAEGTLRALHVIGSGEAGKLLGRTIEASHA